MLWEIIWLIAALAWGCLRIAALRFEANELNIGGENVWSFGQVLPLLLAFLPLWTIFCTLFETNDQAQRVEKSPNMDVSASTVQSSRSDRLNENIAEATPDPESQSTDQNVQPDKAIPTLDLRSVPYRRLSL
ncbi:MAG: hypothetical protein Q9167_003764 [Letrouitia subvulpina]